MCKEATLNVSTVEYYVCRSLRAAGDAVRGAAALYAGRRVLAGQHVLPHRTQHRRRLLLRFPSRVGTATAPSPGPQRHPKRSLYISFI